MEDVSFGYVDETRSCEDVSLTLRRGEIVALTGPNGIGKTTLAKIAAGLLEPEGGTVERRGRRRYLSQDPGRYLVTDRVEDEVALASTATSAGLAAHSPSSSLAGFESGIRAISPAASASASLLPACSSPTRTSSILDEPTRGVDPAAQGRARGA